MWTLENTLLSTQTKRERCELQTALEDISYTCGAQLQGLGFTGRLEEVYTRDIFCEDPIETLYYSAKYVYIVQLAWIQTQRITTPNV